jgi:rhodanese-related sulfurtransferase
MSFEISSKSVFMKNFTHEIQTAVICQSGSRSQFAAALLSQQGFKKVYNVVGGMSAWQMSGLEGFCGVLLFIFCASRKK